MPDKIDPYRSYGQKIISLFAKLLFSGESYSLTELSKHFSCSKQTILRLVEDIRRSYGVEVEEDMKERRRYFRIRRPGGAVPPLNLTEMEMATLFMCRAFAGHLLGEGIFEETSRALDKSQALVPGDGRVSFAHFASFKPGSIDYTPHQESIRSLIEAMEKRKVCRVSYRSASSEKSKSFFIKPLKIFSHRDTVYLHARLAKKPTEAYSEPDYDPLLAVHRIEAVEITERLYEYPKNYDFEKVFNRNFGIIKEEAFEVEVEFTGFAARYVSERIWSPDQRIETLGDEGIRLTFSASSEPEVLSWLLSFGGEAKLLKPARLVKTIKETVGALNRTYGGK